MAKIGPKKCLFCKINKKRGISVLKDFICLDCEKEIAGLSPDDPRYHVYLSDIKEFWKNLKEQENVTVYKHPHS